MRKLLAGLAVAVAMVAIGAVENKAQAFSMCPGGPNSVGALTAPAVGVAAGVGVKVAAQGFLSAEGATGASVFQAVGGGFTVGYPLLLVSMVACDIANGGLSRNLAEVTPGAGYHSIDMERAAALKHEFNVAMGYSDDADTTRFLASASR